MILSLCSLSLSLLTLSAHSLCSLSLLAILRSLYSLSLLALSAHYLCSLYPHSRFPLPLSPSTPKHKVYAVGVYVDTARPGFRAAVGAYVPAWNDAATGAARAVDDAFYDAMATAETDKAIVLKLYRGVATATMVQALESALVPRVQQRLLFSKGGDDLKGGMRSLSSTAVALRCEATDSEATVAKKDATAKESVALRYDAMGAAVVASFRELLVREIKGDQLEEGTELVFLWRKSTEAEAGAGAEVAGAGTEGAKASAGASVGAGVGAGVGEASCTTSTLDIMVRSPGCPELRTLGIIEGGAHPASRALVAALCWGLFDTFLGKASVTPSLRAQLKSELG